jgi:hypothetical protein
VSDKSKSNPADSAKGYGDVSQVSEEDNQTLPTTPAEKTKSEKNNGDKPKK